MGFLCSRTVVFLLIILTTQVYSSDLDQELRSTLAMNQQALTEQCSASAHHSQALSQLLKKLERSQQLESQGISQVVVRMAEAVSQLSQELSPLIQLNKELATQQSSSLTKLVQVAEDTKASQSQMAEEMRASLRNVTEELTEKIANLLNQQTETMKEALEEMTWTLRLLDARSGLQSDMERVSDGIFMKIMTDRNWEGARINCQKMGGDLATPPSDMEAFKTFVYKAIGGSYAWLGGREEMFRGYKYLNGTQVDPQLWRSGEPDDPNECLCMYAGDDPPLMGCRCSDHYYSICRYV